MRLVETTAFLGEAALRTVPVREMAMRSPSGALADGRMILGDDTARIGRSASRGALTRSAEEETDAKPFVVAVGTMGRSAVGIVREDGLRIASTRIMAMMTAVPAMIGTDRGRAALRLLDDVVTMGAIALN